MPHTCLRTDKDGFNVKRDFSCRDRSYTSALGVVAELWLNCQDSRRRVRNYLREEAGFASNCIVFFPESIYFPEGKLCAASSVALVSNNMDRSSFHLKGKREFLIILAKASSKQVTYGARIK